MAKHVKPIAVASLVIGLSTAPGAWAKDMSSRGKGVANKSAMSQRVLDMRAMLDQNGPRGHHGFPYKSFREHKKPSIRLSGYVSADLNYTTRGPRFAGSVDFNKSGKWTSDVRLSHFALFADSRINRWVTAHGTLHYSQSSNYSWGRLKGIKVDEAYVRMYDPMNSPIFMQVGLGYSPFGTYATPYAMTQSLTQIFEQMNKPMLQVGFVDESGLHASVFAFNKGHHEDNSRNSIDEFGAKVGYSGQSEGALFHVNVSYLDDLRNVEIFENSNSAWLWGDRSEAAVAAHADVHYDKFCASVDYVTATDKIIKVNNKSKTWAAGIHGGYMFKAAEMNSVIGLGYEATGDAAYLKVGTWSVPKDRYIADWSVRVAPKTTVMLQYVYNKPYSGNGSKSQSVNARISADLF